MTCKIKRQNEEFILETKDGTTTVTDEKDTVVTITYSSGHFNVRLPNGWGYWHDTLEQAVDRAVRLCIDYRKHVTEEEAVKQMQDFVEQCKEKE